MWTNAHTFLFVRQFTNMHKVKAASLHQSKMIHFLWGLLQNLFVKNTVGGGESIFDVMAYFE